LVDGLCAAYRLVNLLTYGLYKVAFDRCVTAMPIELILKLKIEKLVT